MKYYVEYPIPIECGLRCPMCFHQQLWQHNERFPRDRFGDECPFTIGQLIAWRDKHLADATEFLYELHGGEPSDPRCQPAVFEALDSLGRGMFQIQTNGLGAAAFYAELIKRGDKINRVGCTYHRRMIADKPKMVGKFIENVNILKDAGLNVYVKELLLMEDKADILRNRAYWESMGVEFRIQDFKGVDDKGNLQSERYAAEDWAMVHPEYCHYGPGCSCREGYKQVLVRGYDIYAGDVLACWQDHKVVGNIMEDWYNPDYAVGVDRQAPRGRSVRGVDSKYRSDYAQDLRKSQVEHELYKLNKKEVKLRAIIQAELEKLAQKQSSLESALNQARVSVEQLSVALIETRASITMGNRILQEQDAAEAAEAARAAGAGA